MAGWWRRRDKWDGDQTMQRRRLALFAGISAIAVAATGAAAASPLVGPLQHINWPTLNVRDFGAKGDGVNYDDVFIQNALNAVPTTGAIVYVPAGTYRMRNTVFAKSGTLIMGDAGAIWLADTTWNTGSGFLSFISNANFNYPTHITPPVIYTDFDITIQGLTFDYGTFVSVVTGAKHALFFTMVKGLTIRNCTLYGRDAGGGTPSPAADATAAVACANVLIDGCRAYNFRNCCYDHWANPTNCAVTNCYAENLDIGQVCNFNPDTDGADTGLVADGFRLSGNTFVSKAGTTQPVLISPLNAGCTVKNVIVTDNVFDDVSVVYRGDVESITITGNVTRNLTVAPAFDAYTNQGGTPSGVSLTGNVILNPATLIGNQGVIRLLSDKGVISGNAITGTAYGSTPGIFTGTNLPQVFGNYVSNGIISANSGLQLQNWLTTQFNAGNLIPPGGSSGSWGWNASGGAGEVAYFNNASGPGMAHIFWQRTGTSTSNRLFDIDPSGNVTAYGSLHIAGPTGPSWSSGTGAPGATAPIGSLYSQTNGGVGSTLYVSRGGGTWLPVAGV